MSKAQLLTTKQHTSPASICLLACSKTYAVASENIHSGHHQTWSSGPFPGMKWQRTICRHPLTTSCKAQGPLAWAMWATLKAPLWALPPSAHSLSLHIRWSPHRSAVLYHLVLFYQKQHEHHDPVVPYAAVVCSKATGMSLVCREPISTPHIMTDMVCRDR